MQYQDGKPQQLNLVAIKEELVACIHLDCASIKALFQVPKGGLPVLLDHYKEVFTDELGTIKQFNARLSMLSQHFQSFVNLNLYPLP